MIGSPRQAAFRALLWACAQEVQQRCPEGFRAEVELDFASQDLVMRLSSDGISGVVKKTLDRDALLEILELGLPMRCYPFDRDITAMRDELMRHTLP